MRYSWKKYFTAFSLLILMLLFSQNFQQKARAVSLVTGAFARASQNEWIFLSQYTDPGHLLETPDADLQVFYNTANTPANLQIRVDIMCRGAGNPGGGVKVGSLPISAFPSCAGLNDPHTKSFTISPSQLSPGATDYGPNYQFLDMRLIVTTSVPLAVRVVATDGAGLVTARPVPYANTATAFGSPKPNVTNLGSTNPFTTSPMTNYAVALWSNINNNPATTTKSFSLRFTTPCQVPNGVSRSAYLRWYDADQGQGDQISGLSWTLVDNTTGVSYTDSALGGNDEYRELQRSFIGGHEYTWIWNNVSATNGIQVWLPFSEINDTIRLAGQCNTPKCPDGSAIPPSGVCPSGGNYCSIFPSGATTVNAGTGASFTVRAHNGSGASWTGSTNAVSVPRQWAVYLTMAGPSGGTPSPYGPNPYGNYIQKYSPTPDPGVPFPTAQGSLLDGQTSAPSTIGVDTSSVGVKTYNFYLVRLVSPAPSFVYLAPNNLTGAPHCSISYTVTTPPPPPNNIILSGSYSCTSVSANARWQNPDPAPISVSISINGTPVSGNPVDPFAAIPTLPINLNSYNVTISAFATDSYGQPHSANTSGRFGPCFISSCLPASAIDFEPGETKNVGDLGGFSITNRTSRTGGFAINTTVTGMTVAYPNPYSFSASGGPTSYRVVPTSSATANSSAITINRTLTYPLGTLNTCPTETGTNASRPYLKVFGSDVGAGGWFYNGGVNCSSSSNRQVGSTKGGIRTFASANVAGHPYRSGSSSQYGAFALGDIDASNASRLGFYSWGLGSMNKPNLSITSLNPLDFANNPSDGTLGFSSGGSNTALESCIPDYYSNVNGSLLASLNGNPPVSGGGSGQNSASIFRINGNTTMVGNTWNLAPGQRLTIYVNGNAYINHDINYPKSIIDPAYFSLVVKGNIYIDPSVRNLDGLYIAQPDYTSGAGGRVVTCANNAGPFSANLVPSTCDKNKLVINGAVIAKYITFNRTGDLINNTLSHVTQSDPETSTLTGGSNHAMEEINYTPDMVTGSPLFTNSSSSQIDEITVLPPLF